MSKARQTLVGQTVTEALGAKHNGFALLRLALALAVVVSHAWSVTSGHVTDEPLLRLTGFTLGEHAVNGFFAISGFLVTLSFARRGPRDYVLSRALRILPGLVAAVLVVAFVLGPVLTRWPAGEYLTSGRSWSFVWQTLTSFKTNIALPGLFSDNPLTFPMGTVWTLKYEVICYAGVLAAGLAGVLRRRWTLLVGLVLWALALLLVLFFAPDAPKGVQTALRLPFIFAIGGALCLWGDRTRLSWPGALAGLALAAILSRSFVYDAALFAAEAYAAIVAAYLPVFRDRRLDPSFDLSYGTYLYGWPVQQALVQLFPGLPSLALLPPALAITLAAAFASWFAIEKPALSLKARTLGRRAFGPQASLKRTQDVSHPASHAKP